MLSDSSDVRIFRTVLNTLDGVLSCKGSSLACEVLVLKNTASVSYLIAYAQSFVRVQHLYSGVCFTVYSNCFSWKGLCIAS